MADLVYYVDPNAAGANNGTSWTDAYTTMNAWEQAQDQDLTNAGGDTMTCYFRSSGAHPADTTAVTVTGWTTGSGMDIRILHADFLDDSETLAGAKYDTSKYRIEPGAIDSGGIYIYEDYITVKGLQVKAGTVPTANGRHAFTVSNITATNNAIVLAYCYGYGHNNDSFSSSAFNCSDADVNLTTYNCVGWNRRPTPGSTDFAFYFTSAAGTVIYNCTGYGGYGAVRCGTVDSIIAKNCIGQGNSTSSYLGNFNDNSDYNISDDASTTGGANDLQNHTVDFTDETTGDFTLAAAEEHATDNPGAGLFLDDMGGVTRTSPWDCGADEYVAAGAVPPPDIHSISATSGNKSGMGNIDNISTWNRKKFEFKENEKWQEQYLRLSRRQKQPSRHRARNALFV